MYGGMWTAAVLAMGGIYLAQGHDDGAAVVRGPEGPLFTVENAPTNVARVEPTATQRPSHPSSTTQARGNRRHTGQTSRRGPETSTRAWVHTTEQHVVGQAAEGPDGVLYIGSRDRNLYALNPDGTLLWRRDLGADIYATPAVFGDAVYAGSDANFFFILEAATGEVRVHLRTEGDVDTGIAVNEEGQAFFGAGRDLWCVTPQGTLAWRFRAGDKIFSAPAIADDGTIYVGAQDDYLYAIQPSGELRWRYRAGGDVDSSPVIGDDGTIYFGSDDHRVYALDRNGTLRFRVEMGGYVRAALALGRDHNILVPVFGPHPRIASLDTATGEEQWSFGVGGTDANELGVGSSPLVDVDGNIFFGADDDYVYSIDRTGHMRWIYETGGNVDSDPILTEGGLLVVGSDDHLVHAIR